MVLHEKKNNKILLSYLSCILKEMTYKFADICHRRQFTIAIYDIHVP